MLRTVAGPGQGWAISCLFCALAGGSCASYSANGTDPLAARPSGTIEQSAEIRGAEIRGAEPTAPSAAESSAKAPESSDPEPLVNTVRWSTASEVDNFGYDIYRGESPDGPFERINEETVEGAGTSDEVHRYHFVDDTIEPDKDYYYYVESISLSGTRERFTPIGKAPAKRPGKSPEPKSDS